MTLNKNLPLTEELDFHYLLTLMPPLSNEPEFAWLPELFSIVGYESLIKLCKYAGGEHIRIPTLDELSDAICALQWFYDIKVKGCRRSEEIPENMYPLYLKICSCYDGALDA